MFWCILSSEIELSQGRYHPGYVRDGSIHLGARSGLVEDFPECYYDREFQCAFTLLAQ